MIDPDISKMYYALVSDTPRGIMMIKMGEHKVPSIFRTPEEAQNILNKSLNDNGMDWCGVDVPPEYRVEECMVTLLPPLKGRKKYE